MVNSGKRNFTGLLLFTVILISCGEGTRFRLIDPVKSGIEFSNTLTESDTFNVITYEYIYNGAGVGAGDLNNDGLCDLVFAGNMVSPRVYLNLGKFKFRDITTNFRGLSDDQWYGSVSLADLNGDGWLDVYLTSTTNPDLNKCRNRLWISQEIDEYGVPYYKEMAGKYGIDYAGQSTSAAFFDYDNDGDLDLYVLINTINQRMNTTIAERITDGKAVNNDRLFRNNGDGSFTDITIEAGIVYEGFGLGLAMGDVNKDGLTDIYVSNDFITNDLLYINQGDGTFRNEIRKYLSYQTRSSMGNDMADVNNDGNPDIFTLDMLPETIIKKKQTNGGAGYRFYEIDYEFGFEHQYIRNMLHIHNGFINNKILPFSELGQMLGLQASEWSWSPLFADFDNDGDKDLLIANGFPRDMTDKDYTLYKTKYYGYLVDALQAIKTAPPVKVQNFAFENTGELSFTNRSKEWFPYIPSFSYGAVFADLDNDGDLDYVTNNIDDKAFVFRNYTMERSGGKSNYIRLRLKGENGNSMAIGAKVELWAEGKYQFQEQFLTRGYASSVEPVVHFGLNSMKSVDSIKISWPASDKVTVLHNPGVNQTISIDEKDAAIRSGSKQSVTASGYLFEEASDLLVYKHEQKDFPDFYAGQNIIPHKFSQIGPIMAKGDLNNDNMEDLIIGSTNTLPTNVFLRKGNGFVKTEIEGLTTRKEFSEGDLSIADIDGDGDNDVLAAAGAYENQDEADYRHYLYQNNEGAFTRQQLPVPPFPSAVIRTCDFDNDGDIDFFIGSRIKNGMFPYANHSWVIINNKGKFIADSTFRLNLGMVTDALWSDFDGDGWKDLIVTREWNSIAVLKNIGGQKLEAQNLSGFEEHKGIWYSVTGGDFDSDGDTDYIFGNLGDNHKFTTLSPKYPSNLYALDIDMNGTIDPISTAFWKNEKGELSEYPVNYLDELVGQSTYFSKLFTDYKSFSLATIDRILDENIMKRLEFKLQVNTSSSYIVWNENGTFRWEKLPVPLQVSPLTKCIVKDFNGDGFPDLLAGGNDHSYDVSTGEYDANKGVLMLSKGTSRSFDVLQPAQTGLLLNGMLGSLLLFDGDTTLIVSGFNRSEAVVYKYNK